MALQHREIPLHLPVQVGSAQVTVGASGVDHTAWRQRIERIGVLARRGEVAVDIDDHVGRIGNIDAHRALCTCGHNGRIGLHSAIRRIQRGNQRLVLSGRPDGQISQGSARNYSHIQRIRRARRNIAVRALRKREAARSVPLQHRSAERPVRVARVHYAARRGSNKLHRVVYRQTEDCATAAEAGSACRVCAIRGCPIEVPIGGLHQPAERRFAVTVVEAVQRGQRAAWGDFEDRATAAVGCAVGPAM